MRPADPECRDDRGADLVAGRTVGQSHRREQLAGERGVATPEGQFDCLHGAEELRPGLTLVGVQGSS